MNRAKVTSQTSYQIYRPEFEQQNARRLSLSTDLRYALERDEFTLFYQPKVFLTQKEIAGVEALIRWNHPRYGLISPVEFVPLLEESGLIDEVGIWVIQEACRQQQRWLQNGLPIVKVAVNISARQFEDKNLADVVGAAVNKAGGDCANLELELTESLLMSDLDHTVKILGQLSDMGFSLSIDDFGTGYSSLIYLTKLPVHTLKIDREFIRNIPNNAHEIEVARAIIALSHTLNLEVVAEGVETEEQLKFLREHHCDYAQGYYYAKPLPAAELAKLVGKWRFASAGHA
jgi:EAL domain-containing protein (putative c-di-GMP-specific phosphodiesterase class I)